ncbi:MFS transporter [Streptomyces sp. NPDC001389]|uniref:MFS transporter n=1 Tax=unclassified Streptomyces TaxID=2593676 RepID=UPI0036C6B6FD
MRLHQVWHNGGFRRLWASVGVSVAGTHVTTLALPLTALGALDATPGQVALLSAAGTVPFLLLGLPAGAWVDRWPRRTLMIHCDTIRFLLLATVPVSYLLGGLVLAQLYLVAFGVGAVTVFFDVAALSVLPALVVPEQIPVANGRLEAVRATAQTSGPAVGGALVQVLGAPLAMALDAVSYLVSALLLHGLPELPAPVPRQQEKLARQMAIGLRFCLTHPYVRPLALAAAWINLCTEGMLAVFVVHAVDDLRLSAATVGVILAVSNLGYLAGSLATPWLNARIGVGPAIALGAVLNGGFVVAGFAQGTHTVGWLIAGFTITAVGVGVWNVDAVSLRQAATPRELLSRMNATNRFLIWGTMPLGAGAGALLAGAFGPHAAVLVCAVAAPGSVLPIAFSTVRRVRVMPTSPVRTVEAVA